MRAHGDLGGRVFLPIHWATFNLAFHRWAEPAQRSAPPRTGWARRSVIPLPGQRVDVLKPPPLLDWWTAVGSAGPAARRRGSGAPSWRGRSPACWHSCRTDRGAWPLGLRLSSSRRVARLERLQPHRVRPSLPAEAAGQRPYFHADRWRPPCRSSRAAPRGRVRAGLPRGERQRHRRHRRRPGAGRRHQFRRRGPHRPGPGPGTLDWAYGSYWRVDVDAGALRFVQESGDAGEEFRQVTLAASFKRGVGLAGRAWQAEDLGLRGRPRPTAGLRAGPGGAAGGRAERHLLPAAGERCRHRDDGLLRHRDLYPPPPSGSTRCGRSASWCPRRSSGCSRRGAGRGRP